MPRVFIKKKNRGGTKIFTCSECGKPIEAGQEYLTWKFNRGDRFFRHPEHGMPRRSELISNSKMGQVWDAVDDFDVSTCTTLGDIKAVLASVAKVARSVAEQYEESVENILTAWPSGNPTSEACQSTAHELRSWAINLELWRADPGKYNAKQFDTKEAWLETIREQAQDVVNEQPEYQR